MAILHPATLTPSKLEVLGKYLQAQPWFQDKLGAPAEIKLLTAYRFDDPAGEVGIESHIARTTSGASVHVPLTYRAEPLAGAQDWLISKMEHSALGTRWIYDACGDAVYANAVVHAILSGGTNVALFIRRDGGDVPIDPLLGLTVKGSGTDEGANPHVASVTTRTVGADTHVDAGGHDLVVHHLLQDSTQTTSPTLSGTWEGQSAPVILAQLS